MNETVLAASAPSSAYEREFHRRTRMSGVWYPVLSIVLFSGSAGSVPWDVTAVFLLLQAAALVARTRAWSAGRTESVARLAVVQGLLYGTFLAWVQAVDPSTQTIALSMVLLCGVCATGTTSMSIPPGRQGLWLAASITPSALVLMSDAERNWPLGLAILASFIYMLVQGKHVREGLDRTHRTAATLLAAYEEQRSLVSHLSHDVRTPLSATLGYLQLAQDEWQIDAAHQCTRNAELQLRSSLDLLNHLLDVARSNHGFAESKIVEFSPDADVLSTCALYEAEAAKKGVALTVASVPSDDSLLLRGPARAIKRSLTNLLSNAVRYTNEGMIRVRADLLDRDLGRFYLLIEVSDSGPGIPDHVLRQIKRIQEGEDPAPVCSEQGEGLGLAGTACMLRSIGGQLEAECHENVGSIVRVRIPVSRVEPRDAPAAPAQVPSAAEAYDPR